MDSLILAQLWRLSKLGAVLLSHDASTGRVGVIVHFTNLGLGNAFEALPLFRPHVVGELIAAFNRVLSGLLGDLNLGHEPITELEVLCILCLLLTLRQSVIDWHGLCEAGFLRNLLDIVKHVTEVLVAGHASAGVALILEIEVDLTANLVVDVTGPLKHSL